MNDCQRIEAALGRELTVAEMCGCAVALLDGHTEAEIIADLKRHDEGRAAK